MVNDTFTLNASPISDVYSLLRGKGEFGSNAGRQEMERKAAAEAKLAAEIAAREKEEMAFDGVWVMMNGLPGKMGFDVAAACLRKGFRVTPYVLTGASIEDVEAVVNDQEVRKPRRAREAGWKTEIPNVILNEDEGDPTKCGRSKLDPIAYST